MRKEQGKNPLGENWIKAPLTGKIPPFVPPFFKGRGEFEITLCCSGRRQQKGQVAERDFNLLTQHPTNLSKINRTGTLYIYIYIFLLSTISKEES